MSVTLIKRESVTAFRWGKGGKGEMGGVTQANESGMCGFNLPYDSYHLPEDSKCLLKFTLAALYS